MSVPLGQAQRSRSRPNLPPYCSLILFVPLEPTLAPELPHFALIRYDERFYGTLGLTIATNGFGHED